MGVSDCAGSKAQQACKLTQTGRTQLVGPQKDCTGDRCAQTNDDTLDISLTSYTASGGQQTAFSGKGEVQDEKGDEDILDRDEKVFSISREWEFVS